MTKMASLGENVEFPQFSLDSNGMLTDFVFPCILITRFVSLQDILVDIYDILNTIDRLLYLCHGHLYYWISALMSDPLHALFFPDSLFLMASQTWLRVLYARIKSSGMWIQPNHLSNPRDVK